MHVNRTEPASVYMNIYNFVFFSIRDIKNPLSGQYLNKECRCKISFCLGSLLALSLRSWETLMVTVFSIISLTMVDLDVLAFFWLQSTHFLLLANLLSISIFRRNAGNKTTKKIQNDKNSYKILSNQKRCSISRDSEILSDFLKTNNNHFGMVTFLRVYGHIFIIKTISNNLIHFQK